MSIAARTHALHEAVREATWLTRERIRAYALIVLAMSVLSFGSVLVRSDGLNAADGQPIGSDFSNVYAAGKLTLQGRPAAAYDWSVHHDAERAVFGAATPYYGWHYPPMFLALAAVLALLPYLAALVLWQGGTLLLYLAAMRAILRGVPGWLWPALAFPAVLINVGHGQNGFLTAALFGGGLALLERRPALAGLLLGALCYKPQFGLLMPLALAAGGHWRALAAAAAAAIGLGLASAALFGIDAWQAFAGSLHLTRTVVLEQGSTGWHKIQSVFSAARNVGAGLELAYALQAAMTLAVAAGIVLVWRSGAAPERKAAALLAGAILATPYSLDYDMMVLAPALAFLVVRGLREGFAPYERPLLALAWLAPLVARMVMLATAVPLGAIVMAGLFAQIVLAGLSGRRAPGTRLAAAE